MTSAERNQIHKTQWEARLRFLLSHSLTLARELSQNTQNWWFWRDFVGNLFTYTEASGFMIQLTRFFKLVETETANLLDILGESTMTSRKVFIPLCSTHPETAKAIQKRGHRYFRLVN